MAVQKVADYTDFGGNHATLWIDVANNGSINQAGADNDTSYPLWVQVYDRPSGAVLAEVVVGAGEHPTWNVPQGRRWADAETRSQWPWRPA